MGTRSQSKLRGVLRVLPDGAGVLAVSDGRGRFTTSAAPAGTESATAAQFFDYDNDGLLDLVIASNTGLRVFRNLGNKWENTSERAVAKDLFGNVGVIRAFAAHGQQATSQV